MIIDYLRALIGSAPADFAFLEYIFAGVFAVFLVSSVVSVLSSVFRFISGRR